MRKQAQGQSYCAQVIQPVGGKAALQTQVCLIPSCSFSFHKIGIVAALLKLGVTGFLTMYVSKGGREKGMRERGEHSSRVQLCSAQRVVSQRASGGGVLEAASLHPSMCSAHPQ